MFSLEGFLVIKGLFKRNFPIHVKLFRGRSKHIYNDLPFMFSSRSHLVLMLSVEGRDKVTGAITKGTLVLCDLAGSERISKTEAEGQRLVEAAAINKSLSALGQVGRVLVE